MKKSRLLGLTLAAAIAVPVSMPAFAYQIDPALTENSDIKHHTVGIVGSFINWGTSGEHDIPMNDDDNDGVYEGTVYIPNVTQDMISEALTDIGDEGVVSRGFEGVQFKVRTNENWSNSWGDYELAYNRTYNSQTCCCVEAEVGKPLTIEVKLDTTTIVDQSMVEEDDRFYVDMDDSFYVWPVTYKVVPSEPITRLTNTSTISSNQTAVGSYISINPSSVGSDNPVKYSVFYRKSNSTKWYSIPVDNSEIRMYPKTAVPYDVMVIAKDSKGEVSKKTFNVKVNKALQNTTTLSSDTIKLGEKVKVRFSAKYGGDYYEYKVYCKKSSAKTWFLLTDYTAFNVMFKPQTATSYDIRVYVRDGYYTVKSKTLTLNVTK